MSAPQTDRSAGPAGRGHAAAVAMLFIAGAAIPAVGGPVDPPRAGSMGGCAVRANVFTSSDQAHTVVGANPRGHVVAAWESRRQDAGTYGVYARAFDAAGTPCTPEVRINQYAPGAQHAPAVSVGASGEAWIVWTSLGQDGDQGSIVGRRLDASLALGTGEIAVNATRAGNQHSPVVAVNGAGRALIAWSHEPEPGDRRVVARVFDASGRPLGDEARVDTGSGTDGGVTVAAAPDGSFVLAWGRTDPEGRPIGIVARRLESDGRPAAGERVLAEGPALEPSLSIDPDGNAVLAWQAATDDGYAALARWFDAALQPIGHAALLADGPTSGAASLAVGPGHGVVAINRIDPASGRAAPATCDFATPGIPGPLVPLAAAPAGDQRLGAGVGGSRLALAGGGTLAVAWNGDSGAGDTSGACLSLVGLGDRTASIAGAPVGPEAMLAVAAAPGPEDMPPIWDPNWKPQAPAGATADGPDFGFEGIPGTGWTPPDPDIAVGPSHLVLIANGQIAFFDKTGVNSLRATLSGAGGFWTPAGASGQVFDPETLYDPRSGRFWAMACERASGSFFLLAVSDDSDPNGVWFKYRFNVTSLAGSDIDSPGFAVDHEAVYMIADFFTGGDKLLTFMVPKATLLAGGPAPAGKSLLITGSQSYGHAVSHSPKPPAQYLLQSTELASNTTVILHAISDATGTPTRVTFTLPVATYLYPGAPPQMGSSVTMTLFEPRLWSALERDGSIWACQHIRTAASGSRTIVRWYEFLTNGWPDSGLNPSIRQWGEIDPGAPLHAYFASIGADAEGNAAITFARSGTTEFIGMWRAERRWNDAPGTFRPMEIVKASTSAFNSFGRWGDYCGTDPDPAGGCVLWGHHEWTNTPTNWRTWVARYENYALTDLTADCALTVADFGAFQTLFVQGDPRADFSGDGQLSVSDFGAFQTLFVQGR